jgi:hypothetical protein
MYENSSPARWIPQDWLPWALSVFGASCAVFVLVRGVLPARTANAELVQTVARLQADLARTTQSQNDERAQAKAQLTLQSASNQQQLSAARRHERARVGRDIAQRDLSGQLRSQIEKGAVALEERNQELVISIDDELMFNSRSVTLKSTGRRFLRLIAKSMQRLPSDQIYRIGGPSAEHQRLVMSFLEQVTRIPGEQLVMAGAASSGNAGRTQATAPSADDGFEIVLLGGEH